MLQAAAYLPIVLFSILGGAVADRSRRSSIIAGSDFLRALFLSFCALALKTFDGIPPLAIIIPVVFLNGTMQAFFSPSVISFILDFQHVSGNIGKHPHRTGRKPDLLSLRTGSGHLASLIGQTIGAGVYTAIGIIPMLFLNAAAFFMSAVSELFLTDSRGKVEAKKRKRTFASLVGELLSVQSQGAPVLMYLASQAAGAAVLVNLPFFLGERLHFPANYLGYAMASLLGGSILTGFLLGFLKKIPATRSVSKSAAAAAVCLIGAGFLPGGHTFLRPELIFPLFFITGGAMGWIHIVTVHAVHRLGNRETAASRQGFLEAAATAVLPVSYLLSGLIFEQLPLNTPWIIRTAGIVMLLLSGISMVRRANA